MGEKLNIGDRVIFNRGMFPCNHELYLFGISTCLMNGKEGKISDPSGISEDMVFILLDELCPCHPYHLEYKHGIQTKIKGTKCIAFIDDLILTTFKKQEWRTSGLTPEDLMAL